MKIEFDIERNISKWGNRLKKYGKKGPEEIKDPIIDEFCDAVTNVITDSPSKTGQTRAGWVKPLREEGKDVPDLLGDDEEIPKEKREEYAKKGEEGSFYFKDVDEKNKMMVVEVVNTNSGAIFQEYGDSQQPPTGIIRRESIEMQNKLKDRLGKVIEDLGD